MKRRATNKIMMAFLLSMLMVLSMGMSVFAETATKNISITNAKDGSTYSVYQVMTAKIAGQDNDGNNVYNYTVADNFKGFFNGSPYGLNEQNEITKDGTVVSGDSRWTNTNLTEAAALAAALSKYAIANNISPVAELTSAAATAQPIGYYVIAETQSTENSDKDDKDAAEVATKPILVDLTKEDAKITLKDDTTTLDKVIDENGGVKTNNVSIGDSVPFKITTKIPTYEANVDKTKLMFKLTDTFSEGLTYNDDIAIEGFTKGTDYTAALDGQVLTIEFTQDAIYNNQGKAVVATYSATLNEKAKVDSTEGNPNDVILEYTNNTNEDESHKTLKDETKTYTYGFNVHKVDKAAPSTGLADAKFQLTDEDGNVIKFVYDEDTDTYTVAEDQNAEGLVDVITSVGGEGLATVKGLKEGTYYLEETQAPDNYTKLSDKVQVTITAVKDQDGKETGVAELTANGGGNAKAEGGTAVVDEDGNKTGSVESDGSTININVYIENAKGISLPETGRNTALYCMIGGAALIIFGTAYYILGARRKREYE